MGKRAKFPHSRHHVQVYDEDWDYLQRRFKLPSPVIRDLIARYIAMLRAKDQAAADRASPPPG